MPKIYGIIYKAVNKVNGKMYIGQTIKLLEKRKYIHIRDALNNRDNFYFHKAIRRYGKENFVWKIIAKCNSLEELNKIEVENIKKHGSFKNGYNLTKGGKGRVGYKYTDEERKEISEKVKNAMTKEVRRKISESRKGVIPWNKNKKGLQIAWNKGIPLSDETKDKISKASNNVGENNPMYGKKHLDYSKILMTQSKSFKWVIIDPFGKKFVIENLKKFCKENNLDQSSLWYVAYRKKHKQHKGYKCKRLYEEFIICKN